MRDSNSNDYRPKAIGKSQDTVVSNAKTLQEDLESIARLVTKLQKKLRIVGGKEKPTSQIITLEEVGKKPSQIIWLPPDYR